MFVYFAMFTMAAASVAMYGYGSFYRQRIFLIVLSFFYIFFVGMRFQVGCDWNAYMNHFETALSINNEWGSWMSISSDIGYSLLNLLVASFSNKLLWVNVICASIAISGLYRFSKLQPSPLIVYLVAVPYIIIVFFQGYTRQSVAFGLELWGLAALIQGKNFKFIFYIFLAATFHKTAIVLAPLAALVSTKNKWWTYFWVLLMSALVYFLVLFENQASLVENYINQTMTSDGAGIRVALNVVPSILFLIFKNRFIFKTESEKKLWVWISIISLTCIPLLFLSTTVADRFALYLMPIQLFVFATLPFIFPKFKQVLIVCIASLYASILFVWLFFSTHSVCWVPYNIWI